LLDPPVIFSQLFISR